MTWSSTYNDVDIQNKPGEGFSILVGKGTQTTNGGKVELNRFASFLGKSYEVFKLLFSIFEDTNLIKIKEKAENYYIIDFTQEDDLAKVLHSPKYAILTDLIAECEEFQKSLLEEDLYTIV